MRCVPVRSSQPARNPAWTFPLQPTRILIAVTRRDLILRGAAAGGLIALLGAGRTASWAAGSSAETAGPGRSPQFEEVLQSILRDAEPVDGAPLTLELPELAENGNVVPYRIAVDNPMTDTDYVRTLYLLSTSNPQALVARFQLIPASGKAAVSGRMRLARTQDVVAIAEVSTGQVLIATRRVEVTIGGCGNE